MAVISKRVHRIAVGILFFMQGLCFSSWASRIPTIQQQLHLSEAALGVILLSIPFGSLVSLPLSGWLVAKTGSRRVAIMTQILYGIALLTLGIATSIIQLVICLFLFGNFLNTAHLVTINYIN